MTAIALWQQPAPVDLPEKKPPRETSLEEGAEIAVRTIEALQPGGPGYFYWRCNAMGGDTIKVTNSPQVGVIAEYSLNEILLMGRLPATTMILVHRVKVKYGAELLSVEGK